MASAGEHMPHSRTESESRRRFLRFRASSPLMALACSRDSSFKKLTSSAQANAAVPFRDPLTQDPRVIASAAEALDVMEFEPVARKNLPPAHYGYLRSRR